MPFYSSVSAANATAKKKRKQNKSFHGQSCDPLPQYMHGCCCCATCLLLCANQASQKDSDILKNNYIIIKCLFILIDREGTWIQHGVMSMSSLPPTPRHNIVPTSNPSFHRKRCILLLHFSLVDASTTSTVATTCNVHLYCLELSTLSH